MSNRPTRPELYDPKKGEGGGAKAFVETLRAVHGHRGFTGPAATIRRRSGTGPVSAKAEPQSRIVMSSLAGATVIAP